MENKLETFIVSLLPKHIITDVKLSPLKGLSYRVTGFSKSGGVDIYLNIHNEIEVKARYDEITTIEEYDDLVRLAFNWYLRYKDREPFTEPSWEWVDDFVRLGLLKVEKTVVTKYIV